MHSRKNPTIIMRSREQHVSLENGHDNNDGMIDDEEAMITEKMLPSPLQKIDQESSAASTTTTSPSIKSSSSSSYSTTAPPTKAKRIGTALFYAISSIWVIFANKIVLSTYQFPSVLAIALLQFGFTTLALQIANILGYVSLVPISTKGVITILPLSTCYLLNIVTGLSATQNLSLPIMVLLRRASILMTMVLERYMLNIQPSTTVQASVGLMLGGALVAALGDLSFNTLGYIVIFFNDLFTALNGVLLKRTSDEYKKSSMTVLYLNSLLSALGVSIIILLMPGEIDRVRNFDLWTNTAFIANLTFAASMGSVLNLAIFLCTSTNSALTTTVVGCLKNVLTSYLGMFIGGDYIFSWLSFVGINLSIAGSLVYANATFRG